jgi:hypothetical protein
MDPIRRKAKTADRVIGDSFDFLKSYLEGALSNQETMLREILKYMHYPKPSRSSLVF